MEALALCACNIYLYLCVLLALICFNLCHLNKILIYIPGNIAAYKYNLCLSGAQTIEE